MEDFKSRVKKSTRIRSRHPDRLPVIIVPVNVTIDQLKYLPHKESSFGEFMHMIRRYITLNKEQSLLCFVDDKLIPLTNTIDMIYKIHMNQDGYLYVTILAENTFG
jgi:hypothetical protein